jgi:hypothetical protein
MTDDTMIRWYNDRWYNVQMIQWSDDTMIRWYNDRWYNDQMIQWSDDTMIRWYNDKTPKINKSIYCIVFRWSLSFCPFLLIIVSSDHCIIWSLYHLIIVSSDHGQATGKFYHLRLRVECTFFVIYKAGREPMPYWW